MLAAYRILWVPFIAFFFSVVLNGSITLQLKTQLHSALGGILTGVMVLFVLLFGSAKQLGIGGEHFAPVVARVQHRVIKIRDDRQGSAPVSERTVHVHPCDIKALQIQSLVLSGRFLPGHRHGERIARARLLRPFTAANRADRGKSQCDGCLICGAHRSPTGTTRCA